MTPLTLEILIQAYISPDSHLRPYAPAVRDTVKGLVSIGALEPCEPDGPLKLTLRGRAWLAVILATPIPDQLFLDHHKNLVEPI